MIATSAQHIHERALVWDTHACFPLNPNSDLTELTRYKNSGVSFISLNIGMDMDNPAIDYCQLAQSMGMRAVKVSNPADLDTALKAGIQSGQPNLIEVMVSNGFGN